jgi:Legionella pneumophila major outer membrane protein precursor
MSFHALKIFFLLLLCSLLSLHAAAPPKEVQEGTNGLPNISTRLHPESRDFTLYASLLIWTAKEAGADCWAEVITSDSSSSSNDLKSVHFGWDPGFRVGLGYGMQHDQWDTQAYYTWFYTKGTDHVSSLPGAVHSTFLGNFYVNNPTGAGLSGPSYQKASIDWTIRFNMFDWELGRSFWISKSLSLRPFVGVKGGWIHQSIRSKWHNVNLSGAQFFSLGRETLKNNFWGVGPQAGVSTRWNLLARESHSLSLFGDFSAALMWGHWSFGDLFTNDLNQEVSVHLQNMRSGASMVRALMGLGWSVNFSENRYRLSTKLGYEMQFWLDQLQFYSFTGGRLANELTLQGGTLEFCFEF